MTTQYSVKCTDKDEAPSQEPDVAKSNAEAVHPDDDGVPEVVEEDGEEAESPPKRARVTFAYNESNDGAEHVVGGSTEEDAGVSAEGAQEEEEDTGEEPESKRMRTQLSVVREKVKKLSWADLTDAEEEECKRSRRCLDI